MQFSTHSSLYFLLLLSCFLGYTFACEELPVPASGSISYSSGTTNGSVATYNCSSGYAIQGPERRTCSEDGTWSGSGITTCLTDCGPLTPPVNGWIYYRYATTYGSFAYHYCYTGYFINGTSSRNCQANGTWSGSSPSCDTVDCGLLPVPENGSVTYSRNTSYGSRASFTCQQEYILRGSSVRTCGSSGTWSGLSTSCDSFDILVRLSDGSANEGRVEVSNGTAWGTVCHRNWDHLDAGVVCRMLNYSNGFAIRGAYFGQGNGSIFMDEVQCDGSEASLRECPFSGWENNNCYHFWDASVHCFNQDLAIRLIGGNTSDEGRVEVSTDGFEWGTVCDHSWGDVDARVACKMLNYSEGIVVPNSLHGEGTGRILLDNVYCRGYESSLDECNSVWANHNCDHSEDVSVWCFNEDSIGRCTNTTDCIEIEENSRCNVGVCVCNAGYRKFGPSCLKDCTSLPSMTSRLRFITNYATLTIKGLIFYQNVTTACFPGFADSSGEEFRTSTCYASNSWVNLPPACSSQNFTARLVGGNSSEGRLEVSPDGIEWGSVCDNGWSTLDAIVACRMVGFSHGIALPRGSYGQGNGSIFMHYVSCSGSQTSLIDCSFSYWNTTNCNHIYDVSVSCYNGGSTNTSSASTIATSTSSPPTTTAAIVILRRGQDSIPDLPDTRRTIFHDTTAPVRFHVQGNNVHIPKLSAKR